MHLPRRLKGKDGTFGDAGIRTLGTGYPIRQFSKLLLSTAQAHLHSFLSGEGRIRTHGEFPHDGFQDRCLKPLGHFSG